MPTTPSRRWLPNLLTGSRFPLSVAMYVFLVREMFLHAFGTLLLAQTTDWIDGALARRWGARTRLGAIMEHVADTFMLVMAGLGLTVAHLLPRWLFVTSLVYCLLTWITPERIKRLWVLNVILGMRTLLYGMALAVIPFILLHVIAQRSPTTALVTLILFVLYGIGTLHWKRGRIEYYCRRFWRQIHSSPTR